jgi:uncharacterized protein YmfQ (DUF2313 family)
MMTREQYTQAFIQLMPLGFLFNTESDSNLYKLMIAICANYELFDFYVDQFIEESFPNTTLELLPEWEANYGLPDDCSQPDDTIETRRKILLAKYNALGGQSPAYFIQIAAYLGFTITITEFNGFKTNIDKTNSPLYSDDWQWVWQVNTADGAVFFKTNLSTANEPLIQYSDNRLTCFLEKIKPAHTRLIFNITPEL